MIKGITNKISIDGLSEQDKIDIEKFLRILVDSWCAQHPNEWFAARDLVHTINWNESPLARLNDLDEKTGREEASGNAGRLLWNVLVTDSREFEKQDTNPKKYRLVK
jgi:hypothetical protein